MPAGPVHTKTGTLLCLRPANVCMSKICRDQLQSKPFGPFLFVGHVQIEMQILLCYHNMRLMVRPRPRIPVPIFRFTTPASQSAKYVRKRLDTK